MNEKQVKDVLSVYRLEWKDFEEWMHGQTMIRLPDGSIGYHDIDVTNFINSKRYGKAYSWD